MENGKIAFFDVEEVGLGTIEPANPPGNVSFDKDVLQNPWSELFVECPVDFTRAAGTTLATSVVLRPDLL